KLIGMHAFTIEEQPPDQGGFAIIDGAGGDQAQYRGVGQEWIDYRVHQKYPSFLRRSMEASEVWSSMRVAPRSVMLVMAVSAMMARGVSASDATGQVQEMSPTVRKRTERVCTVSSTCGGVSGVTGTNKPLRGITSR